MARQIGKLTKTPGQVSLYVGSSLEAAWENLLLPWFQAVAPRAFEQAAPVAVVTPFRSYAHLLRSKLLAHGISLLDVRSLVPAQLREFLQSAEIPSVPLREHLRLLLSVAANECVAHFEHDDTIENALIARSVAREPDELLRAIDNVSAAGTRFSDLASPALAQITTRFEDMLERCGCALVAGADRLLLQAARAGKPRFSNLLVSGFDAAHWPLWPLLHAAVRSAQDATVILRQPRDEAAELDRTWISTWEEYFGPARQLAPPRAEPRFAALLTLPQTVMEIDARKENPLGDVHFALGRDSNEQAQAIVALAIGFLNEPCCDRLAILLPGPGGLARLVASWLEKLRIPHNDTIAHPMRGTFDTAEWRAWLELQERPQLESLLRFLAHSPAAVALFAPLSLRQTEDTLQRACGDILINAMDVVREYCRSKKDNPNHQTVASALDAIRFLPESATFKEFVETADEIFRAFKWTEHSAELERLAHGWSGGLADHLPRDHFLRWLSEIFAESSLSRDACGDHPYARVQLLRYDQVETGGWSHVIFGALNEGVWPPRDDESPFLSDDAIASLNARNQEHSKRFGEGQQIAREGTILCLGARERRALALRQLLNAIESTTHGIGVAAELYTQSPREQAINPSDFFARLYFSARGQALSQRDIAQLHQRTFDWLAQTDLFKPSAPNDAELKQTGVAYCARRRPDAEFGEYEFAFRKGSPPALKTFSATDVGNSLQRPALVWMKVFLGVDAEELNGTSWSLATGQWVHRWLASIGTPRENRFIPRPSPGEIVRRVTTEADSFRDEILSTLTECGRKREPDWWRSGWRNARHLAEQFAKQLAATEDWPRLATEWRLDSPHMIHLGGGDELRVRGYADLILARGERANEIWIVDYKTGDAEPLKSRTDDLRKHLLAGDGIQICVYALALHPRDREISASLLTRDTNLEQQLTFQDIIAQVEIWKEIARMQRTGIFGMRGELRSEFKFTGIYPLATLWIDKDLLEAKWERTHPPLAKRRDQ
jgi:hypothetical protein